MGFTGLDGLRSMYQAIYFLQKAIHDQVFVARFWCWWVRLGVVGKKPSFGWFGSTAKGCRKKKKKKTVGRRCLWTLFSFVYVIFWCSLHILQG